MVPKSTETQKTIKSAFTVKGAGLHTGKSVTVTVKPALPNTGICFKRIDSATGEAVRATITNLVAKPGLGGRQTVLVCGDKSVQTIEHLMSALNAFGIDNAIVEIEGDELPALDGSSLSYAEAIKKNGREDQKVAREYCEITEPVYLNSGATSMVVLPSKEFKISYTLSYNHESLSDQFISLTVDEDTYIKELAPARTFCLLEEAKALRDKGFGKGASYENTLVFDNNLPVNNKLRFSNEAVRHKVVDLIGDLYLLGRPLRGHVIAYRTGHTQNFELVKKLIALQQKQGASSQAAAQAEGAFEVMQLDINDIMEFAPHRYPALFVDKVIELVPGKRAVAIKNVTINEPFFQGHFPGHPIMPGVLIVEALAQVGGIVVLRCEGNRGKLAYFMSIDKAKFRAPVLPGDQLRMEVDVIKAKGRFGVCACKAYVEKKLVCEADVKFTLVDR